MSNDGPAAQFTPFYRPLVYYLREERPLRALKQTSADKCVQNTSMLVAGIVYLSFYVLGVLSMHTILGHMYNRKNVWFAVLLGLLTLMAGFSTMDDLTQIGSPWGIQEASRVASVLLGLRLRVLVPVTVIFSVAMFCFVLGDVGTSLALAFPKTVDVLLFGLFQDLVFAILGVQLFSGKFWRCTDGAVARRDECVGGGASWASISLYLDERGYARARVGGLAMCATECCGPREAHAGIVKR